MRNYDLSPLWRSTIGFDRLLELLDESVRNADTLIMPHRTLRAPESGAFRRGWSA
jgi:molecular chaperone IbpA